MQRHFTVSGRWPFPADMLRHDRAVAATPADGVKISRMTGENSDPEFGLKRISIDIIMDAGEADKHHPEGRMTPNWRRWESFDWSVSGDPAIESEMAMKAENARRRQVLRSAQTKLDAAGLTEEERDALGILRTGDSLN
jgi:hypothetical protein